MTVLIAWLVLMLLTTGFLCRLFALNPRDDD
jgi:hypothetical protein